MYLTGTNKLTSKLVGSKNKPNQQTVVFPGDAVTDLVESLKSIRLIPGIGSSTCKLFGDDPDSVPSVEDVRSMSEADIRLKLGGNSDLAKTIKVCRQ